MVERSNILICIDVSEWIAKGLADKFRELCVSCCAHCSKWQNRVFIRESSQFYDVHFEREIDVGQRLLLQFPRCSRTDSHFVISLFPPTISSSHVN